MNIKIIETNNKNIYFDEIYNMLKAADNEFLPPLSARTSTTDQNLSKTPSGKNGITNYFDEIKNQNLIIAEENGKLLSFMSYRENYANSEITKSSFPNIYISTILVSPLSRGMGLTRKMYDFLISYYKNTTIFTRTWSTNFAHIKILSSLGFDAFRILPNDRGNNIDTIYFSKKA